MPKILITGASGFIGGVAAQKFRDEGWKVVGLGRRKTDLKDYLRADLSAKSFPEKLMTTIANVDVILHAAARSSPWGTSQQFHLANVFATQNLLDAVLQTTHQTNRELPKLIFLSSPSIYYQPHDQFGITEETAWANPAVNKYATSKQAAERLVRSYKGRWVILRPRAVYGKGDTVLFPRILKAARSGRLPLLIRKGKPAKCDLIAIDNLASHLFKAAESKAIVGEYNLTDNDPQETLAFLLSVFDQLGIARPTREVAISRAMKAASALEFLYGTFLPWKEPPLTRFGVHVFAYSKTFDVAKMLRDFGPPAQSTQSAVAEFVQWVKREHPY